MEFARSMNGLYRIMSKRIYVSGTNKIEINVFSKSGDEILDVLLSLGYELSDNPKSDFLINFNHNPASYKAFLKNGGARNRAILIRLEPTAVHPIQYKKSILANYGFVLSPGYVIVDEFNAERTNFPYRYHKNPAVPVAGNRSLESVMNEEYKRGAYEDWQNRNLLVTLIAANKVSASGNNYYGIRRNLANKMGEFELSLFGPLWRDSLFTKMRHRLAVAFFSLKSGVIPNLKSVYGHLHRRYVNSRGTVADKHEILKQSKFNLVIENAPETVSEKLFDALIAGAIPIYIGPNLAKFNLPESLVIETDGSIGHVREVINNYDERKIKEVLKSGSDFITSGQFVNEWAADKVNSNIARAIDKYIEDQK